MPRVCRKLACARGETLVETVTAILVMALASVIFAAMVVSSTRLNAAAKTADEVYYAGLSAAETNAGTGAGTVRVEWDATYQEFTVVLTGTDGELRSYIKSEGGG